MHLKVVGDLSNNGVDITLDADGTYDVSQVGSGAAYKETELDENTMMDCVMDWLAS